MEILSQIVSIFAMMSIVLSFQCKSNKKLTACLALGAFLFAASYFMKGSYAGAALNILTLFANLACLKESLRKKWVFGIVALAFVVSTCFTMDSWWSWVLMAAQLSGIYAVMFKSGKFIRNIRFFFISPVWLITNTVVVFLIGGIICETITMASIIISFIRYRKTGFEK